MDYEFFPEEEMKCKHCGKWDMDDDFMKKLIEARKLANIPFVINSGYRCKEYDNSMSGGGNHPQGKAADIQATDHRTRFTIVKALMNVGFKRIGVSRNFVHVDTCEEKCQDLLWLY